MFETEIQDNRTILYPSFGQSAKSLNDGLHEHQYSVTIEPLVAVLALIVSNVTVALNLKKKTVTH